MVQVDETGTEAAAATGIAVGATAAGQARYVPRRPSILVPGSGQGTPGAFCSWAGWRTRADDAHRQPPALGAAPTLPAEAGIAAAIRADFSAQPRPSRT